ncbi:MAG: response regulator [Bacillota bacterium]
MEKKQIDALMQTVKKAFYEDLCFKIEEIERMLILCGTECGLEDAQTILKFFHTINGTASTLGIDHLSIIGRRWELELKKILELKPNLDLATIKDIQEELSGIKEKLGCISKTKTVDMYNLLTKDYLNPSNKGKILLVDDDLTILKLLENALTIEGYDVYICDDSTTAFDLVAIIRPDVIMLDIMMPEIDGYQLLADIKGEPEYADVHVIFLSAVTGIDDKIKGMKAGADDYITKPFVIDEVLTRVETVLRRSSSYREKLLKDELTDAYSRYYFNLRIIEELDRFRRNGIVFSIAFVDIDHYKAVNDKYGHQVGDYVLKKLVSYLAGNIRRCDSLYRYGGEEFVILLPDTPELKAYAVVDRLRVGFAQELIKVGEIGIRTTFSAGIAQVEGSDTTDEQLVCNADAAMYQAKKLGRNRVVVYDEGMLAKGYLKTLLLVDDEPAILDLLKDRLSRAGYNIVTAENGRKAIKLAEEFCPDVVILDLILPDIDGFEVCKQIKRNITNCTAKIIILSKRQEEDSIAEGLQLGADDYLTKPFSLVELEARIAKVLDG